MHSSRLPLPWLAAVSLFAVACFGSSGSGSPVPADGGSAGGAGHDASTPRGSLDAGTVHGGGKDAGAVADAGGSTPPGSFTLGLPQNGDSDVSVTPTLSWNGANGADSYTVEVSTDPNFGTDLVNKPGVANTSLTLTTGLKPGTIYYWRVRAVNGAGSGVASKAPFWMSAPVTVGSNPHGIAITPDGTMAVVANAGNPGGMTFVDLTTFATQALSFAGQPSSQPGIAAITPDGATALVVQLNNVVLVGLASKSVTGVFPSPCVGTTLYGIAVTPDGTTAVVPDLSGGCTKTVVDLVALPSGTLTKAFQPTAPANAFGVAVTPDGVSALITGGVTSTSMLQLALGSGAFTTIANTSSTYGVAVTPDGTTALATSGSGDTVKIISLATGSVTGSIDYASNTDVGNIAIAPGGQTAVAVGDFDVGILSIPTSSVVTKLPGAGRSVAITPDGKRALFTGAGASGKLHVIKLP